VIFAKPSYNLIGDLLVQEKQEDKRNFNMKSMLEENWNIIFTVTAS
jgi:hypothetical protein